MLGLRIDLEDIVTANAEEARKCFCGDGVRVGSLLISPAGLSTSGGDSYVLSLQDLVMLPEPDGGVLGCGSSGLVRRARDSRTGQLVAVKEIKYSSPAHLNEIRRELETLHAGVHPPCRNLVDFYGAFCHDGSVFIAMECLDGSLDALPKPVPTAVLAHLTRSMLRGLVYLHRTRHLIHRDFKPSNVLFKRSTGDIKISDFGVSSFLECTKGGACSFVGTVTYMSPERLKGDMYSYAADIWSLGLVVAELAVGVCPFATMRGDCTEARFWALVQHLSSDKPVLELPPTLSPALAAFIQACVCKDPEQRPTCSELLTQPFITTYCVTGGGDEKASDEADAADRAAICRWIAESEKAEAHGETIAPHDGDAAAAAVTASAPDMTRPGNTNEIRELGDMQVTVTLGEAQGRNSHAETAPHDATGVAATDASIVAGGGKPAEVSAGTPVAHARHGFARGHHRKTHGKKHVLTSPCNLATSPMLPHGPDCATDTPLNLDDELNKLLL